ncbi:MAG: RHS repeat-associated core domain-containing protein [Limnohabitans sp.]|nr:RHS repeat-associated core domain-containing protein [Limnohabitans sp.]
MPPEWLYRGFTGHEMLPEYGLINMNARFYDPANGRMLRPDNFVSDPFNSQGYNRFSYANNNPLKFTDPDGNFPILAVAIGVAFGMYTGGAMANGGELNPTKWDYNSGRTWSYMVAGGVVGGFSGGLGAQIAQGGGIFANTMGIVFSSYTNSLGTALYTGGASGMSVSFGIASYNFINGDVGFLGEKGNKWYQDLGYAMGGLANLQDAVTGINSTEINASTQHGKDIPHEYLQETSDKDMIISAGHSDPTVYKWTNKDDVGLLHTLDYARDWGVHIRRGCQQEVHPTNWNVKLNVNKVVYERMCNRMCNGKDIMGWGKLKYGTNMFGCHGTAARALWRLGVPTVPINFHPAMLYGQLLLREGGIYASPFLINLK